MGKGSRRRRCQVSQEIETANWESVFGKKKLNIMSDEDLKEFKVDIELDKIDKIIKKYEFNGECGSHYEGTEDFRGSDY